MPHREFSDHVISLSRSFLSTRAAAPDQGGLLTGKDPTQFNSMDPLRLWIIQVGIIMITTQLLSLVLRRLRQPRVIAEVLGGILLGPTAFGAIPGFSNHIFPTDSTPYLSLVANIGLCLFLFLVGLEIETDVIKKNARSSAAIAFAGISLPFGLGAALAVPLYNQFIDPTAVRYTHFMLFTGVAYSITAFPVLCRILTELKLLDTTVGIVVLSAGVGNDIIGWTLLALSVALVNAGSGLTALYILLVCLGWTLLVLFPFRWFFGWLARNTGSVENGPSIFFMTTTVLFLFASAFFTDVIGVHAIFGAFLAGLIVPREGGLAIKMTEKLEDMVSIIFLPLYFTLSGLSTNLRLLDTGLIWGYVVGICALAFVGKFGGCTAAARFIGFSWREASTIGSLMSCKGLIELIVLNVGLSAGILTQRVFSMFVLEALTLTCLTTPLVSILYPQEHRVRISAAGTFNNVQGEGPDLERRASGSSADDADDGWRRRFTFVLDRLEHLPGMMAIAQLLPPAPDNASENGNSSGDESEKDSEPRRLSFAKRRRHDERRSVQLAALRLIELTRTSEVMKASVADSLVHTDPVLSVFRMFGELHGLRVIPSLAIVPHEDLAASVGDHARATGSQLVVLPWLAPHAPPPPAEHTAPPMSGPFDALFRTAAPDHRAASVQHAHFVRAVFAHAAVDVALFVDCARPAPSPRTHVFLPFFGGPDDRLALELVIQLCANPAVAASVVRIVRRDVPEEGVRAPEPALVADHTAINAQTVASTTGFPDTVYGHQNTQTRLLSETADAVAWTRHASSPPPRAAFSELATPSPLRAAVGRAAALAAEGGARLLVVTGRARRLAPEDHSAELKEMEVGRERVGSEVRKTVGDVATAFVLEGVQAGLLVMQAVVAAA
ncbi:Sodium/hydrogen exchanger family-domain-containing protein [Vararia minispora EC-137]|uniref:Sodium/hydrogen exchanger family-domain-containing protein n=1 Tax=Vararia minispora EC-137 TaxID=1314806 RepID=A0ACB8QMX2_9AGAM|nr:Sodium/hydrogen exchanger family-domain-containing protein [Vararia minispora EC-137]